MKTATTYTMRDLSRETAKVFAAAKKFGSVIIKSRTGEVFTIFKNTAPKSSNQSQKDITAEFIRDNAARSERMKAAGYEPPPASEMERINRIIAGEE